MRMGLWRGLLRRMRMRRSNVVYGMDGVWLVYELVFIPVRSCMVQVVIGIRSTFTASRIVHKIPYTLLSDLQFDSISFEHRKCS